MAITAAMAIPDLAQVLANPVLTFLLRVALGAYVLWMARGFYQDPFGYFRRWMPNMLEPEWMRQLVRATAAFCIWGGCFIIAAAVASQIFGLQGIVWALLLMALAGCAAYLLLPGPTRKFGPGSPEDNSVGRSK